MDSLNRGESVKLYKINHVNGKPMGVIGFFMRWAKASRARKLDEGLFEMKEYEKRREERLKQTQYETALQWQLRKETIQLQSGRVQSFTFKLKPEMYQYFQVILKSPEFSQFQFTEIGKFEYQVNMKIGGDTFEI